MQTVEVAVGVVSDRNGAVLIAKRPAGVHQGGLWEFPGGKLEGGETVPQALTRELEEELGIRVRASEPLIRLTHDYPGRRVCLHVHRVLAFDGVPVGREGQPVAWVAPAELDRYPMPAADRPIRTALRLPDTYLITGAGAPDKGRFLEKLEGALMSGVRLVQLRANELSSAEYEHLAETAQACCVRHGAQLMIKGSPQRLERIHGAGLHLTAAQLAELDSRPVGSDRLLCASCHDQTELRRAQALGVDFVVLSPVRRTATHPTAQPLGWNTFAELVKEVALPVFALGGLSPEYLGTAKRHGAQGIAAIRGLWG